MIDINSFEDNYGAAQDRFSGMIDSPDLSWAVANGENGQVGLFSEVRADFRQVDTHGKALNMLVGKVLLMPNRGQHMSPVILSEVDGQIEMTMLDLPFDPSVGVSDGLHFALSAKAQTRVDQFGAHSSSGGFEAGHFSTVLAASSEGGGEIANALMSSGDSATHLVINKGTVETMSGLNMLDLPYRTKRLPNDSTSVPRIFWHPALVGEQGHITGNFPQATKLLLGAGAAAIGSSGLVRAERLVEEAIRGA